ncbi:MAG: Acetoin:2,6-dichlorophenolindophenol oxidoreductase subunit alpha [Chlamydiae bacterium]|nr:Acetoin:2,6-dichlorophenolindophenol oxidoreductase subunit alpha [Chlamydiota bacterium]
MIVYNHEKEGTLKKSLSRAMTEKKQTSQYQLKSFDKGKLIKELGKEKLISLIKQMLLTRNFEIRAESAYQQGNIGGFFHAYIGQEAIQTACVDVFGVNNWWSVSYRCHAMALLLGATPNEIMAELFGRANGNAQGRGGSMHLFTERMLGGFGIVAGQVPIAIGAALSLKVLKKDDEFSFCFLGDGAVAQGIFFESVNIATLWDLPCIFVVENNQWGMGTAVNRAIALNPIGESVAKAFNIDGYVIDGMDVLSSHYSFQKIKEKALKDRKPIIIEAFTERFRGHSISDPALYRSKESLKGIMQNDSILNLKNDLIGAGMLDEEGFKALEKETRDLAMESIKFAEQSPWPDPIVLEEGVLEEE